MLQPIDRPLFWALVAVAVALFFAALVGAGLFDHLFDNGSPQQPAISQPVMSLIAAVIGGFFALGGVVVTHFLTRRRAKLDQAAVSRRYLKAVQDELVTAWNSYHEDIGSEVEGLTSGTGLGPIDIQDSRGAVCVIHRPPACKGLEAMDGEAI